MRISGSPSQRIRFRSENALRLRISMRLAALRLRQAAMRYARVAATQYSRDGLSSRL